MFTQSAGFSGDGERATARKVKAVGDKLRRCGGVPKSAMKKYDNRSRWAVASIWKKQVSQRIALWTPCVNVSGCVLEDFAVPCFANWRHFLQNLTHG